MPGRAKNPGKKFPKYSQTSFSVIVNCFVINDVITKCNGETKQIIYHSKGIDTSYPKNVLFIEFEPLCQKVWAFLSNFAVFMMPTHQI